MKKDVIKELENGYVKLWAEKYDLIRKTWSIESRMQQIKNKLIQLDKNYDTEVCENNVCRPGRACMDEGGTK